MPVPGVGTMTALRFAAAFDAPPEGSATVVGGMGVEGG